MIFILSQGFTLGLAYTAPIGAQNLFVINSAAKGSMNSALRTALIFAAMDISLGIACILGVGSVIQNYEIARLLIGGVGAGFLIYIGYNLIGKKADTNTSSSYSAFGSLWKAAFLLTWCNPHAFVDGAVVLGGYQSALATHAEVLIFSLGVALASSTWFLSVSTLANRFKSFFSGTRIAYMNAICGLAMIWFGLSLAGSVFGVWK